MKEARDGMSQAVVFLDVDGVVNVLGHPSDLTAPGWPWQAVHIPPAPPICTSPALGDWLRSLPADIVWATTWCRYVPTLEALSGYLGLDAERRVAGDLMFLDDNDWDEDDPDFEWEDTCGKRDAVDEYLHDHPGTIGCWVDDDLTAADARWAVRRNVVPIRSDPRLGLSSPRLRQAIIEAVDPQRPCSCHGPNCRLLANDPRHGSYNGYGNLKCRCGPCCEGKRREAAEKRWTQNWRAKNRARGLNARGKPYASR